MFCENSKRKMGGGGQVWGGGSGWGGGGGGVQGGCEWRSEAFVKIQKKNNFFWEGGGSGRGGGRVEGSGWIGTEK